MIKFIFVFSFILFFSNVLLAQNEKEEKKTENIKIENIQPKPTEPKFSLAFEGQLGVYTNGEAFFVNLGGPALRVRHKKMSFGWIIAPTLRFWEDAPRPFIIPTVGTGLEITYKRFGIGFPLFYNVAKNEWIPTVGLLYKLK